MAALLLTGIGAIISGITFPLGNYMVSTLLGHGEGERVRHDQAIEQIQKEQIKYAKDRQKRLDFINEELQRESHAEKTFTNVDEAMEVYYLATQKKLPALPPKHVLSDYYHPSEQQKDGEIAFILGGLAVTGFVLYKIKNVVRERTS